MSKIVNIVASQCQPEAEKKFNEWYNTVHIPMLMKFKGLKGVKRCKALQPPKENPVYLALYEFDSLKDVEAFGKSPEMAAARDEMKESWKEGGLQIKWAAPYELLGEWHK